jgi:hypothetical protein
MVAVMSGRANAQAGTNVQIGETGLNGTTLTINGQNFGSSTPAVFVDDTTAAVSTSSNTEIVAEVTALEPGYHIIKVVRDSSEGGTALATLKVE